MPQAHRFVWNKDEARCFITCSASPGFDGIVDNAAGAALLACQQSDADIQSIRVHSPNFVAECQKLGWLDSFGRLAGRLQIVDGHPHLKRVQIELTTACNLRCGYCYSESGPHRTSKLTLEQVERTLDEASELGCLYVDFTGGEFFLYRNWREVLVHANRLGLAITIHSNGTALNKNNLQFVSTQNIRRLQISFDSHLADVHDEVRGLKGAFAKSVEGIALAKSMGINLRTSLMVHRANIAHVGQMINWFSKELKTSINLDRIVKAGGERTAGMGVSERDFFNATAPYLSREISAGRVCYNADNGKTPTPVEPHCGVAQSFVYITADGEIALCPTMTSRDDPLFTGPNLSDMTLREAWLESSYFAKLRFTNCSNVGVCATGQICRGGCRSNAYLATGKIDSPDYVSCNIHKNPTNSFVDFASRYSFEQFGLVE